MNQRVTIERLANILAAALALHWGARGVFLLGSAYREATKQSLRVLSDRAAWVADHIPWLAPLFIVLAMTTASHAAERRVHRASMAVSLGLVVLFSIIAPSLWSSALFPMVGAGAVFGVAWCLHALASGREHVFELERRLRLIVVVVSLGAGFTALIAPDATAAVVKGVMGEGQSAWAVAIVRAGGVFHLAVALLIMILPVQGKLLRAALWGKMAFACLAPGVASFVEPSLLANAAAPLLNELALLGVLGALLHAGRLDDVRFFAALKLAQRAEWNAAIFAEVAGRKLKNPFDRIAGENRAQAAALGEMIGGRDLAAGFEDRLARGMARVFAAVASRASPWHQAGIAEALEKWTLELYERSLTTLAETSLARRTLEEIIAAKRRHLRWLGGARNAARDAAGAGRG